MARKKKSPIVTRTRKSGKKKASQDSSKKPKSIQWALNPKWTDALVSYCINHPIFRSQLFSDSNSNAQEEGRGKKTVGKDSKTSLHGILAQAIFANDPEQKGGYAENPSRYATSIETRLRRYSSLGPFQKILCSHPIFQTEGRVSEASQGAGSYWRWLGAQGHYSRQ